MAEIEHRRTDDITCPWCGYEYADSLAYEESADCLYCPICLLSFSMERNVEVTFTTVKKDAKMPEQLISALVAIQELHSRQLIHLPSWDPHGHPEYRESTHCKACGSAENPCKTRKLADEALTDRMARTNQGENNEEVPERD